MKRFSAIEIETKNPQNVFDDYKREISKAIIEAIEFGVKNKRKQVLFAKIQINGIVCISLSVNQKEYLEVLDQNIENLIEYEEYETCALAVKLKEKLTKQKQVSLENAIQV
jgi:hypothetical protein